MKICKVVDLGEMAYGDALALQWRVVEARKRGAAPDVLVICGHPHVLTLGRNGKAEHLRVSAAELPPLGMELHHINRGGDITYHGPGQVVGYPILQLGEIRRDVAWYVRQLEEAMIRASADFGVDAFRVAGCAGVWVQPAQARQADGAAHVPAAEREKLGAIGVHISRWVTSHGFAYNVSTDLRYFDLIVPCGIAGCRMTSLEKLLARRVMRSAVVERLIQRFGDCFFLEMQPASRAELEEWLPAAESAAGSSVRIESVESGACERGRRIAEIA